jgi:NAD(P)-dependent dehydrogenase (short-subunit alcohol dehydrogenase family)
MTVNQKVAVVTGSSSGIGLETSLTLARNGFHTYATMRNLKKSTNIKEVANKEGLPLYPIELDVNDDVSVKNAIDKIILATTESEERRIDVLVNNAGYALFGAFEDLSMSELKAQFETNFFGIVRVTQAVLPVMRKQRSGIIVNISSIAGRIGFPITSAYVITKFALEGLSESIAYELEPFGIKVVIIEPGVIKTNFMKRIVIAKNALNANSSYSKLLEKFQSALSSMFQKGTPAEEVAKVILHAVTTTNPNSRYTVGEDAATLIDMKKKMSDGEFHKLMLENILK